jgi:hypothetical protein
MQFKKSVFLRRVVHQLFKSNLTFSVVYVFNLQFEKSIKTSGSFTIHFSTPTSTPNFKKHPISIGCSFKFPVKVGVEESIVSSVCSVKAQTTQKVRLDLNRTDSWSVVRGALTIDSSTPTLTRHLNEQPGIRYKVPVPNKTRSKIRPTNDIDLVTEISKYTTT